MPRIYSLNLEMGNKMRNRFYVGMRAYAPWEVFKSIVVPISSTHGHLYNAVMGPFRTRRAAEFTAKYGRGNPHIRHVNDAERIARRYAAFEAAKAAAQDME